MHHSHHVLVDALRHWRSLPPIERKHDPDTLRKFEFALARLHDATERCLEWPAPDSPEHNSFAMAVAEYCVSETAGDIAKVKSTGDKLAAAAADYLRCVTPAAELVS